MIVDGLGRIFDFLECLMESQREQVGLDIELKCVCLDVELTGCHLDVWYPNVHQKMGLILSQLEVRHYHQIIPRKEYNLGGKKAEGEMFGRQTS
jgi:hypothetical protein